MLRSENRKSHAFIPARAKLKRKDRRGRVHKQRGGNKRNESGAEGAAEPALRAVQDGRAARRTQRCIKVSPPIGAVPTCGLNEGGRREGRRDKQGGGGREKDEARMKSFRPMKAGPT